MFYLVNILVNTNGQYGQSIERYEDGDTAKAKYHEKLKNHYTSSNTQRATVELLDDTGSVLYPFAETVIHFVPAVEPVEE